MFSTWMAFGFVTDGLAASSASWVMPLLSAMPEIVSPDCNHTASV